MTDKRFYYLCGLPRAGNPLFSSIMNQNPDIFSSGNSIVCDIMYKVNELRYTEVFELFKDNDALHDVLKNITSNYYSNHNEKYIIDRSLWGLRYNLNMLKSIHDDLKIIVLVRDPKEILASLVKFSYTNNNNYISDNADTVKDRIRFIYNGELVRWMNAVNNLINPENEKHVHLIEYNDLVNNTQDEISKVYKFLNIESFEHHYTDLKQLENNGTPYDDSGIGDGLHTILTDGIRKRDYDMNDYLPKDLSEYDLRPFWRNDI